MNTGLIAILVVVYVGVIGVSIALIRTFRTPPAPPEPDPKEETSSLKYLKDRVVMLEQRDVQRKLCLELAKVISTAQNFDEMARGCVDAVCAVLEAPYGALLWKTTDGQMLEFIYRRGYPENPGFRLPVSASIAGSVVARREPVFVVKPKESISYVPIPGIGEANLLCTPVRMFDDQRFILRVAGINTTKLHSAEVVPTFKLLAPLISSALEKALVSQQSTQRKQELEAMGGISQTLNRTLDTAEICAACVKHLNAVFSYNYATIVRFAEDGTVVPIVSVPREIRLADNVQSSQIMLRNLIESKAPMLIEDVRTSDKLKGTNREIRSYMQMPVYIKGGLFAMVSLTSGEKRTFNRDELVVLDTLAQHIGVTLERATYFGKQEELAMRDGLTGLLNHRVFQEKIVNEQQRLLRYKRPFSLMLLDIDHFKKFNDTYGHQTGDMVLRSVASCLTISCRATDMAFRYGGEEFCMILPETELEKASIFAQRVNVRVRNTKVATPHGDLSVTVSIGLAEGGGWSNSPDVLVEAADKALYRAKESGRDRVCLYRAPATKKTSSPEPDLPTG